MPHNFRHEGFRGGFPGRAEERGGRMRSSWEPGRYVSDEDRYSPDWDDPNATRRFEGDRSYEAGYYGERFEPGRRGSRDLERGHYRRADYDTQRRWGRNPWEERGNDWQTWSGRRDVDEPRRFGGPLPYEERGTRLTDRGPRGLMRWDNSTDESGDYFGTGNYYGAYGTQPGAHASGSAYGDRGYLGAGERLWDEEREEDFGENRAWYGGSSGSAETYGRSDYGAQSGYGREYGPHLSSPTGYGQDYRERFGEQRYGRRPEFGYGFAPEGTQGTFRGRGPKGYERSDERLREVICERLTDDPRIDASEVNVDVRDKIVKLSGAVSDRRTKYEIEDLVERCGAVQDIDNQIRVRAGAGMTQSSGSRIPTSETAGRSASSESESRVGARTGASGKRTS